MIICSGCKEAKNEEDFNKHGAKRQTFCRPCDNKKAREYYALNKEKQKKQINAAKKLRKKALSSWLRELKEASPCADCDKFFPWYVMDFDHLNNKVANVTDMISNVVTKQKLMEEIAKCELVCANCHRIRTFTLNRV
jgi:hypothetical protein